MYVVFAGVAFEKKPSIKKEVSMKLITIKKPYVKQRLQTPSDLLQAETETVAEKKV